MEPQFEKMASDIGQGTGVLLHQANVLFHHSPTWRLLTSEQSRVEEVTFCGEEGEGAVLGGIDYLLCTCVCVCVCGGGGGGGQC